MKAVIVVNTKEIFQGDSVSNEIISLKKINDYTLIEHQILSLKKYDIFDITILANANIGLIKNVLNDGKKLGVSLQYFQVNNKNILLQLKGIKSQLKNDFIVLPSNCYIDLNFRRLLLFHFTKNSQFTIAARAVENPFDYSLLEPDENQRLISIYNTPHNPQTLIKNLVSSGIYIISPKIFKKIKSKDFNENSCILSGLMSLITIYAYQTSEYIRNIRNTKDLESIKSDIKSAYSSRMNLDKNQKAIFLDRDGVINVERSYIRSAERMELYRQSGEAVKKINRSKYKAIVVTNQAMIARNYGTLEQLNEVHKKLETDLGKSKAFVDRIYYCPHHPDKGESNELPEYKIDCNCRKPKPGMLFKAAEDFNIDLSKSFMIGDTERDIIAGRRAGCTTVGVRTGHGVKKSLVTPDYFFNDLKEATDFIIDEPHKWVYDKLKEIKKKTPEVILIGGNDFSGKSTLCSYLIWKFRQEKKSVCRINLDLWLKEMDREHFDGNFLSQINSMQVASEIQRILAGLEVRKDKPLQHPDGEKTFEVFSYKGEDIILIEGLLALNIEELQALATQNLFIKASEYTVIKRATEHYQWAGYSEEEIKEKVNQHFNNVIELQPLKTDIEINYG